jgi:type I restriction enzyme S subunit
MPRGDKKQIFNFSICNFDLPSQFAIAHILSSLDDKIELNNNINKELENMAKTIYDYWFVQFDFPDRNGKSYKTSGGKMVYNEKVKREIPNDWEVKELNDFCNVFTGKKDVNQTVVNGKYKFFSCAPNYLLSNEYIYDGEAILVSGNGSYTGRVSYYNGKFDLYQRTYACVAKNKDITIMPFLYFYMKFFFQPRFKGGTCGSAIPYIVLSDLINLGIPYKSELLEKYSQIAKPLLKRWFDNQQENEVLSQLRDFLLPLLMNGQITAKDIKSNTDNIIPLNKQDNYDQKFELWLKNQGLAARGEANLQILREIFDAMDDDDK